MRFSHTVKLMAVNGQPIEILRTGEFHHPTLGKFEITADMLNQMVENFPGPDILPMDYNHGSLSENPERSLAAGWIQRIYTENKDDRISLMGEIAWTAQAKEYIEAGEFRFVSAEFAFNDVDVTTGETLGTNLLAAALTNRPFVPGMAPVSLKAPQIVTTQLHKYVEEKMLPTSWRFADDCPYQKAYWEDVRKLMLAQPDLAEKTARAQVRARNEKKFSAAFHWHSNSERVRFAVEAEGWADPQAGERELHQRVAAKIPEAYNAWRLA